MPDVPGPKKVRVEIQEINRRVIEQFRAGGEIEGMQRGRLLLLNTVGARTGLPRTTPMMFVRDGDRLLVIASNIGAPQHPDWYLNLVAEPRVGVEVGDERYDAVAQTAQGEQREQLWAELLASFPFFAEHQQKTDRQIPLVLLTRVS